MVSNTELVEFMLKVILANDEINEYCKTHFNTSLLLLVGVDVNNAPQENEMPILILEPVVKNLGTQSDFEYEFFLKLALKGNKEPKLGDDGVLRYEGIYQIEELGNLIALTIEKAINCQTNIDTSEVNFYHDEIAYFPLYSGTIIISFSLPKVIGDRQLRLNHAQGE